jgi:hypothetical protein
MIHNAKVNAILYPNAAPILQPTGQREHLRVTQPHT